MQVKRIMLVFLCVIALSPALLFSQELVLKTAYEDVAPKFMIADGKASGLCVELMDLITKDSGIKFSAPVEYAPKKRFQGDLETGAIDVMFGMKKDAAREKIYVFGDSLYSIEYIALARATETAKVKSVNDILALGDKTVVLTVFGAASVDYLKGLKLTVDDGSKDVESGIMKLTEDRGRFFIYQNLSTMYVLNTSPLKTQVKVIPVDFEKYDHFVAFSKTAKQDAINKIHASIERLKKSGAWAKVTAKYLN
jgi:ABC-type amino acid transport substrate-binding protein